MAILFRHCSSCSGLSFSLPKTDIPPQSQPVLTSHRAVELASSVYGLLGKSESQLNKLHQFVLKYGKIMAIALPVTDVLLLQIPVIENTDVAWVIMTHSICELHIWPMLPGFRSNLSNVKSFVV